MKCYNCESKMDKNNIKLDSFGNIYCAYCGDFWAEIGKTDIEEKEGKKYKAIIKLYVKK